MESHRSILEYFLLTNGGEVEYSTLIPHLSPEEVKIAVAEINKETEKTGRKAVMGDTRVSLIYSNEIHENFSKEEQQTSQPLTPSLRETLACIVYAGPCSASHIESLRGINSRASIKELIRRGYITLLENELYSISLEGLESLNISSPEEAPDYANLRPLMKMEEQV